MATAEACEQALHRLAARLEATDPDHRRRDVDRTLSCRITDLSTTFTGQLRDGLLVDIEQAPVGERAQIRLTLTSDDLLALVDGDLSMGSAFATGRVRIDAGVRDLIRLRSIF